jgi:hypothetical protein
MYSITSVFEHVVWNSMIIGYEYQFDFDNRKAIYSILLEYLQIYEDSIVQFELINQGKNSLAGVSAFLVCMLMTMRCWHRFLIGTMRVIC